MKSFPRLLAMLITIMLVAGNVCIAFSAQEDSGQYLPSASDYLSPDNYGTGTEPGFQPGRESLLPDTGKSDVRGTQRLLKQGEQIPQDMPSTELFNKSEVPEQQQKPKLVVTADGGDGLAALNWKVIGLSPKGSDVIFKFSIQYGTESERYTKKIDVGSVSSYRLRELKNNQVYYIRVSGVNRDARLQVMSDEVMVTPLAADEQGSALERSYAKKRTTLQDKVEPQPINRDIRQFGYEFFRNSLAVMQSGDNLPVGSDYVIGPGDTLRIDIWGTVQGRYEATVDRNGEITIPRVGVVKVWGLAYSQAKEAINKAVARIYKGYELNVTLGKLRTIQVFVVGEVESPGVYSVSSLGTVVNALAAAGGPSKNGSLRAIKLMKGGKVAQFIDLYDMFLSGDRSKDIRLENGDTVFVPVIGPVVAVVGEVKRPAIYELKDKTSLPHVLAMAGGITALSDLGRIQVERIEGNSSLIVLDYELKGKQPDEDLAGVQVRDRDMVKVFPVNAAVRQVVSLTGNVSRTGEYQFRPGMKVTDILPSFKSLLPDTHMEAAEITRLVQPDLHKEVLAFNLQKALEGDAHENLPLHEQDVIRVFSRGEMQEKQVVSINGQVVNPGTYAHYRSMTVRDLITMAGSLKRNAFLDSAELTRIEVEGGKAVATRRPVDLGKALAGDPQHNLELHPDDVVIVRGVVDWLEASDRFVTLKGEVRFPGTYSISKGERLSSVIARAGGFSDKAYLKGAKFTRKSVQETQQKRMNEIILRTEKDIIQKQGELTSLAASRDEIEATRASLDGLLKGLDKLKAAKAEGRVVIRLAPLDVFRMGPYDLELMGGDALEIPQTPSVVNVLGQVYNPTAFVYMSGKAISYYLEKSGGPTREAEESEMYIIKVDGTVISKQQSSFGIRWDDASRSWNFGSFSSAETDPGDTLVVPQKLERIAWMRTIKDITTILSQVALTAGVIIAAGL